jgi:hypothetical protein
MDPDVAGWEDPANLLWAIRHGMTDFTRLRAHFPHGTRAVPPGLVEFATTGYGVGPAGLLMGLASMLFPAEAEMHAFRVLLLLQMPDTSPEELMDLRLEDVEFTDGGVRLVERKDRADRIRPQRHALIPEASGGSGTYQAC